MIGRQLLAVSGSLLALLVVATLAKGDDQVKATGVIRGTVTIDGKTNHHKFAIDESVVSLKGGDLVKLSQVPKDPAVMDQNGIAYVPTVLAVMAGTTVEFKNSDPTLHNVHCSCKMNAPMNIGMQKGETQKTVFANPDVIEITCNIHAQMKAFIFVHENAFFAKAGKDGSFKIENVPPGEYEIQGWHDGTERKKQKVTVKAGEETVLSIDLTSKKRR
jgi:plastocyanin